MKRHGLRYHRIWGIWNSMKRRCSPKASAKDRALYYDKGIRVCEEWKTLVGFTRWAFANGYAHHLELDRKDGRKGYCPSNCRWVTESIQAQNRGKRSDPTSSKYKGVCWFKRRNLWTAQIMKHGCSYFLGNFKDEKEAAKAYDKKAKQLFGENAVLNFPIKAGKKKV